MRNNSEVSITDVVNSKASSDAPTIELKPFLRWAGGKRQLLDRIHKVFPQEFSLDRNSFYEPFIGGGALTFSLASGQFGATSSVYPRQSKVLIGDQNPDLVAVYTTIRDDVDSLIKLLKSPRFEISEKAYYSVRNMDCCQTGVEAAARFIYLNKTGFNGLWRVNSKGHYNVPWGQLKNPTIFEPETLRSVAQRLVGARITHTEYSSAVNSAVANDVVYFDPPYIPLSTSSSFSQYAMADFGLMEQNQLAATIAILKSKSVDVILSNSDTELSREIFGSVMNLYQIDASRAIAAKASSRGSVKEIIGTTMKIEENLLPSEMTPISFC